MLLGVSMWVGTEMALWNHIPNSLFLLLLFKLSDRASIYTWVQYIPFSWKRIEMFQEYHVLYSFSNDLTSYYINHKFQTSKEEKQKKRSIFFID